jgi:pimeloyl-ACP methyl ester carboxylesterase
MAALMKQLHLDKACIIGLSFGGYVAIDVALAYPLMVAALVLGAPALSG